MRETFVSASDQAIIIRLTADKPKSITFDVTLDRPERFETTADAQNGLLMSGQLNNGSDGNGMKYAARLRVLNNGGEVSTVEKYASVKNADEAILFVTAATDYQGFAGRKTANPLAASQNDLTTAVAKSYKNLLAAHVKDFQNYFNRVSLNFGATNSGSAWLCQHLWVSN